MKTSSSGKETVQVTCTDTSVYIHPWPGGKEVKRALTFVRKIRKEVVQEKVDKKTGEIKVKKKMVASKLPTPLFKESDSGGPAVTFTGLFEHTVESLEKLGYNVVARDERERPPPWNPDDMTIEPRYGQMEVMHMVMEEPNGIVSAPPGFGKTELCTQVILLSPPETRFAFVTFDSAVRNEFLDRLEKTLPDIDICQVHSGTKYRSGAKVYLLLDKSLHRLQKDDVDVLIVDEVHGAGSAECMQKLLGFVGKRRYGFSATPAGRHDNSDLGTTACCGPIRCEIPYRDAVKAKVCVPMYVYFYYHQTPDKSKIKNRFVRYKYAILLEWGRQALLAKLAANTDPSQQTLITCKTLEQALDLTQRLPDEFVCVARQPSAERKEQLEKIERERDIPKFRGIEHRIRYDVNQARKDLKSGKLLKSAATPIFKQGVDAPKLIWVVRADAVTNSIGSVQRGGRGTRIQDEIGKTSAGIIDIWDAGPEGEWGSLQRWLEYERYGWNVTAVDFDFDAVRPDRKKT